MILAYAGLNSVVTKKTKKRIAKLYNSGSQVSKSVTCNILSEASFTNLNQMFKFEYHSNFLEFDWRRLKKF